MRIAEEELLLFTDRLVEAIALRMESVSTRVAADEVVPSLGVTRLVGQGVELQIGLGDRADQVLRNDITCEWVAPDSRALLPRSEWVEDLETRADGQER